MNDCALEWAVFDYGGVLAEEGFLAGLHAIARQEKIDKDYLFEATRDLIFSCGYLTGEALEQSFWTAFRQETGIRLSDEALRNEILSRFTLRPWMFETIARLKELGLKTAILSDQVNWLDELDIRDDFFKHFDRVYNSFHVGMSKTDPAIFDDLVQWLNVNPSKILFTDDHLPHVKRARSRGLNAIHFTDRDSFIKELSAFCPETA